MGKTKVAILGSGNIGTDLMLKIQRYSELLEMGMLVGIDPESDGLARARDLGVATTHEGLDGLMKHPMFAEIGVVFDATSAGAHIKHAAKLKDAGKNVVDMTPAAVGPYVVPVANLDAYLDAHEREHKSGGVNVNMVTCGGQATIPMVWAVNQIAKVRYGEIVASIASRSAGPGTRANIDEFTVTTARAIEKVGGADKGKAIIVLNPAEPPLIMRDTVYVFCESDGSPDQQDAIVKSIKDTVAKVAEYVPGYRLVQEPVFDDYNETPLRLPNGEEMRGVKVSCFLEVEGNGDYLPKYAGNLDIMTAAALKVGEELGKRHAAGK